MMLLRAYLGSLRQVMSGLIDINLDIAIPAVLRAWECKAGTKHCWLCSVRA